MNKTLNKFIEFLSSNQAKTFYWTTINGFIALVSLFLTDSNLAFAPVLLALLKTVTKTLNKKVSTKYERRKQQ